MKNKRRRKKMTKTIFDKGGSIWGTRPPVKRIEVCRICEKRFEVNKLFVENHCPECKEKIR